MTRPDGRPVYYMTLGDPADVSLFSGSSHGAWRALAERIPGLRVIRRPVPRPAWLLAGAVRRLPVGGVDLLKSPLYNRVFGRAIARRLRAEDACLVSVINSSVLAEVAPVVPTVYVSDATYACGAALYDPEGTAPAADRRWGDENERRVLASVAHASFSSPWAARSAVEDYGMAPERVSCIPWGCNIPYVPEAAPAPPEVPCRLVTVGVDWERKGFDIAIEVAELLHDRGLPVELDLVGATVPDRFLAGRRVPIRQHGMLRKGVDEERARLTDLYARATFLLLPTRADCTPMVFAEANALGTPAVTWDVGGVTGVVEHGRNGYVADPAGGAAALADLVEAGWRDPEERRKRRAEARRTYEDVLNWDTWADALLPHIERLRRR